MDMSDSVLMQFIECLGVCRLARRRTVARSCLLEGCHLVSMNSSCGTVSANMAKSATALCLSFYLNQLNNTVAAGYLAINFHS